MRQQLINYCKAGYPGLYIVSHEEQRVELELRAVVAAINEGRAADSDKKPFTLYAWSMTQGIVNISCDPPAGLDEKTRDPLAALAYVAKLPECSILLLRDFHLFFAQKNPLMIRSLKDALLLGKMSNRVIVICGAVLNLIPELEKELTVVEFGLPDREQLRLIAREMAKSSGNELNGDTDAILDAASGLTTQEAENAFAKSVVEHGHIQPESVFREKCQTVRKNGVVEVIDSSAGMDSIGGLEILKGWIAKRKHAFTRKAQDYRLPAPKGALLVGPPGTGKSLTAKAAAQILGVPLLKLDFGRLFGSLVGQSESNLRNALQIADSIAPCVLWVDEAEKAVSGSKSSGHTDGGTGARVFGTLLQWMNERKTAVFVIATANDVSALPPEFLRKGRFDEMFFVDLPNEAERAAIWTIQITKAGRNPADYNIARLVEATPDWTGAEIEALFTESLFSAFDENREPDTGLLVKLSGESSPLSKTMSTEIAELRAWAKGRTRPATAPAPATKVNRKLAA